MKKIKRWVALLLCALLLGSLFPVNALADSEYTEYSISVFADGNGTASADKTSAAKGEKVTLTTTPNPGYHFDRWESDDVTINVTITDISFTMPEKDVTVKAIFEADAPKTYIVTFDAGDGSVTPASGTTGTDGKLASLPMPTRSGYLFFGWFDAPTGGNRVTTDTVFTTDSTIYARWAGGGVPQGGCSLTLNENWEDGTVRTIPNVSFYVLPTIIRPGYVFDGWSTDPAGSVEYRENDTITLTADTTLYALWSKSNAPTLILNENWEFGRVRTIPNVSSYVLPTVTRFGETFYGWANAPDGMVRYRAGDTVTLTHNLTLYAIWRAQTHSIYHVIFDANGGTGTMENLMGGVAGAASEPVIIPDCGFTREGYTFKGWATSPTGAVAYLPGNSYKSADDLFLFAVWEQVPSGDVPGIPEAGYSLELDENWTGGAVDSIPNTRSYVLPAPSSRPNYVFLGWSTAPEGDVEYNAGQTIYLSKDTTLYALWGALHTLTLNENWESGKTTQIPDTYSYELPAPGSRDGYAFLGWSTEADGTVEYRADETITLSADTTLYALWNPTVTVTVDGSGTAKANKTVCAPGTEVTLTFSPNEGYHFKEWQAVSPAGLTITDNKFTMPDVSVTVKAVFGTEEPAAQTHNGVTFSAWESATSLPGAGSWYLMQDVVLDADGSKIAWNVRETTNLCLNGHSITALRCAYAICVCMGAALNLYDCAAVPGRIYGPEMGVYNEGTFTMNGGAIFGSSIYGVYNEGTFTMNGGVISGNSESGVYNDGTMTVAGTAQIVNNSLIIPRGRTILLGTAEDGMSVSLEMEEPGVFTAAAADGYRDYFTSADSRYVVTYDEDGKLMLAAAYAVTIADTQNGTVTPGRTPACPGETVSLTVTPDAGYRLKSLKYNDGTDHDISENNGAYSFTMPENDVEVTAIFEADALFVTRIDAEVTAPAAGSTPDLSVSVAAQPDGVHVTGLSLSWYESSVMSFDEENWTRMGTGEPFEEGHYYLAVVRAGFDAPVTRETTGFVNGKATEERFAPLYLNEKAMLFRVWYLPVHHSVTFEMNGHGGRIASQTVEDGSKAIRPADPAAEGWTFGGWYKDSACTETQKYDFNTPVTANLDLYAKWTKDTNPPTPPAPTYYSVSFQMNGHGTQITGQTVEDGHKVTKPADPTASGYTFKGWYTDSTFQTAFDFNTAIHADTTLYAKWTENIMPPTYTIISGANGEWTKGSTTGLAFTSDAPFGKFDNVKVDGSTIAATNYTAEEGSTKITLAPAYLETLRVGRHFVDVVSTDGTASTNFTVKSAAVPPVPTTYTVSFNMSGHGTQITGQTVEDGHKATKPVDPTASGYTFKGWYTGSTFQTAFDFNTAIHADTTLYAKWVTNSVKPTDPNTPKTGDNSHLLLWVVLLAASGAAMTGVAIYSRKKKKTN